MTFMEICRMDRKQLIELIKKRAWGPAGSIVFHIFAVIVLLNVAVGGGEMAAPPVEAIVMETKAEPLEVTPEVKHEQEQEPITEPVEVPEHEIRNNAEYSATEEISDIPDPGRGRGLGTGTGTGVGDGDQAGIQISGVKSPLIMKDLYGSRRSGGRGRELSKWGRNDGVTEGAVLRALRWLKKYQSSDGSWDGKSGGSSGNAPAPAMTGWGLLCFLAHGETPASEEFGPTVEKAIKYLIDDQDGGGRFKGSDGNEYSLPIAAYGLSEAYGMTKVPMIKTAAEKAIAIVVQGQHASGGWNYKCGPEDRDDTSYMGWCAQALKAASMAELDNADGIKAGMKRAIDGFKKNASPSGGFGYTDRNPTGLSGVGVLCMQLMGASREAETRGGLTYLDQVTFDWAKPWGARPIYYWYYITQAKFHAGGEIWTAWNKIFSPSLVKNQIVVKGGGEGGKDIGYWETPAKNAETECGLSYNTTLCCLMLEVYYRYLPTYKPPEDLKEEAPAAAAAAAPDVNIEVK